MARPRLWVTLSQTRAKLGALHQGYTEHIRPFPLQEAEEEDLERLREVARRAKER